MKVEWNNKLKRDWAKVKCIRCGKIDYLSEPRNTYICDECKENERIIFEGRKN
jgi:Zn finger protein HypA/HybF involved in hydrogenase expression